MEEKEDGKSTRKVLRGKIKSPVNQIQRSIVERNLRSKETYEVQLKKKESEILSLNRKVNNLQKTVMEKERTIKSLELKFPKTSPGLALFVKGGRGNEKVAPTLVFSLLRRGGKATSDLPDKTQGPHKVRVMHACLHRCPFPRRG